MNPPAVPPGDHHCHTASIAIAAPATDAFEFLAQPLPGDEWTLGAWSRQPADGDVTVGTSLFDGERAFVRVEADRERLLVAYAVGASPDRLLPRIWARVVPGSDLGGADGTCVLTLAAWRTAEQSDEAWRRTCASHEAEVFLVKGAVERRARQAASGG